MIRWYAQGQLDEEGGNGFRWKSRRSQVLKGFEGLFMQPMCGGYEMIKQQSLS